jgi:hypothetical protein
MLMEGTYAICTDLSASHHLVHSTNLPSTSEAHAAVDGPHKLVHLARSNSQSAPTDTTETQTAGRMGINKHSS